MHILVVGATGRTGQDVVAQAHAAGHTVRAFSRSADATPWPKGVHAMAGDVLVPDQVREAMQGMDAVIVCISMVRASDSPWARILTPLDLHRRAAANLIEAATTARVRRYVMVSAHGVGPSAPRAGTLFLALVRASNIGVAYADLARAETALMSSGLPWTIVRPTRLTREPASSRIEASIDLRTHSRSSIARADVAAFLVREAEHGHHTHTAVSITGRP